MKKILLTFLFLVGVTNFASAQTDTNNAPGLYIQEENGTNSARYRRLKVSNGTLTNNGDGSASLTTGGGGGTGNPAPPVSSVQSNVAGDFGGSNQFVTDNAGNVGIGTTYLDTFHLAVGSASGIPDPPPSITVNYFGTGGLDDMTVTGLYDDSGPTSPTIKFIFTMDGNDGDEDTFTGQIMQFDPDAGRNIIGIFGNFVPISTIAAANPLFGLNFLWGADTGHSTNAVDPESFFNTSGGGLDDINLSGTYTGEHGYPIDWNVGIIGNDGVNEITVINPGSGYSAFDVIGLDCGDGNFEASMLTMTGGITGIDDYINPGTGYTASVTCDVTGGTGTGATIRVDSLQDTARIFAVNENEFSIGWLGLTAYEHFGLVNNDANNDGFGLAVIDGITFEWDSATGHDLSTPVTGSGFELEFNDFYWSINNSPSDNWSVLAFSGGPAGDGIGSIITQDSNGLPSFISDPSASQDPLAKILHSQVSIYNDLTSVANLTLGDYSGFGNFQIFQTANGTKEIPTVVTSPSNLMTIASTGFDGTNYSVGGTLAFNVPANVGIGTSVVPAEFHIGLTDADGTEEDVFFIEPGGDATHDGNLTVKDYLTLETIDATAGALFGAGDDTDLSSTNEGKMIFNVDNEQFEVSENGGAYHAFGGITGSGAADQVTFWDDTTNVTGSANFRWVSDQYLILTEQLNDAQGNSLIFLKTRPSTGNVVNNDDLGEFLFEGHKGAAFQVGASIKAFVDGNVGIGTVPGRIEFYTQDTKSSGVEALRMTIQNSGNIAVTSTKFLLIQNGNPVLHINQPDQNYGLGNGACSSVSSSSSSDVCIGAGSMGNATVTGDNNIAIGQSSFNALTSGNNDSCLGFNCGSSITTGSSNNCQGNQCMVSSGAITGSQNNAVGSSTFPVLTSGGTNTAIGHNSGLGVTTGVSNTYLGYGTGATTGSSSSSIALGALASTTASNQLVIGGDTLQITTAYIGEGVTNATPPATVTINGTGASGNDTSATSLVIASGKSTGNATATSISFQTPTVGSTGGTAQTLSTRLTVNDANIILSNVGLALGPIVLQNDANYTLLNTDIGVAFTGLTATRTVTLPPKADVPDGKVYIIKDMSGNASNTIKITIDPDSTDVIDNALTFDMTTPWQSITIFKRNTGWWIF